MRVEVLLGTEGRELEEASAPSPSWLCEAGNSLAGGEEEKLEGKGLND